MVVAVVRSEPLRSEVSCTSPWSSVQGMKSWLSAGKVGFKVVGTTTIC